MPRYEYKVVPAPAKGRKGKGVKGAEARFSHALQELMNGLAGYGWEYQRAETLPSIERSGLTGTTTEWRNVLVFRRPRENDVDAFAPELLPAPKDPQPTVPSPAAVPQTDQNQEAADAPQAAKTAPPDDESTPQKTEQPWDNGVEDTDDVKGIGASLEKLAAARNASKSTD